MEAGHKYLLFCSVLLSVTFSCYGDSFFNGNANLVLPGSYNIPWMSGIQNFRTLSLITFPGTHNSMAHYGGPEAECQVLSLRDQLRAGIRFLDLKVFALGDSLYVMHGIMYQHSTLKVVLDTVQAFLSEFKTEAVLIRVQPQFFDKNTVNQMVRNLLGNEQHVWVDSGMPTLGQVRGKIVFLQKSTFTLGIPLIDTDGKSNNKVSNVKDKDNKIIKQLNEATEACGGANAILTYSSGTGFGTLWGMFLTPKKVAEKVNPWLNQYLRQFYPNQPRPCFGIIAMDFPGIDLIQTVIGLNWWGQEAV
ncbi:1-phosphatidylinositol phosphodiesterase-like [Genypterus blacodes]|uniref:1-phosphatidylinositol phosphodiesterase-like n=1 Tax=Genypterus blacodes TaxID=154954 RepID=UPI003F76C5E8